MKATRVPALAPLRRRRQGRSGPRCLSEPPKLNRYRSKLPGQIICQMVARLTTNEFAVTAPDVGGLNRIPSTAVSARPTSPQAAQAYTSI